MAYPVADSYSAASGQMILGGISAIRVAQEIVGNGVWTWFTDPRAVYRNGATYIGWVNSFGSCGVSKYTHATQVTESFALATALEVDDHNNTAIHFANDGRLVCFYTKHNDTSGMRYRVSTIAESVAAFGPEILLGGVTKPVTYSNPRYLSKSNKTYIHYRSGQGGPNSNPMNVRATSDFVSWDIERTWLVETGQRPYIKSSSNGIDRIDFAFTNCHPNEGASSIYHCYMQLDVNNNELFYKSDGTLIGTSVTPAQATRIYDGTSVKAWIHQIAYNSAGEPVVLFTTFPSITDHRYNYSRLNGAAWTTPVEIAAAGRYIYLQEPYYSGGVCFDGKNKNKVYLSKKIGSVFEVQEFSSFNGGASWQKTQDITSESSVFNCRPYSPENYDDKLSVLWWSGNYTTFTNYNTGIKGLVRL